eukprot:CAMPEP_0194215604 /NCGR_PEP_ID=MMETSP0156-20130528/17535_1 /TAXON_ID=33649 /ORGANISM="Thalassionema nitzschioides, Strain L26-B" /LENGTH=1518 /DNA_ID=CAMNT_0038944165 /DNA_START=391 /DNA_END=4947 /DNA_ORIENTATION=+
MTSDKNNSDSSKPSRKGGFRSRLKRRNTNSTTDGQKEEDLLQTNDVEDSSEARSVAADQQLSQDDQDDIKNSAATPQRSNAKKSSQATNKDGGPRRGVLERIRSVSRSRSRKRYNSTKEDGRSLLHKPILVAVTSCRSDAYYNQKAPGSTSKLPRKAPSNLKLFHELAVGIKDAYTAVGQMPERPDDTQERNTADAEGKTVLWEFIGNLDFLLALVDEVAIDSATRGVLKDDTSFKSLRDVIKKCNKVLEGMLVRRERRYTLFFRLVQPTETKEIAKLKSWNLKVEKAIGSVADSPSGQSKIDESDSESLQSSDASVTSSRGGGMFNRGRQLLPSAGRVRARRATPTPTLRNRRGAGQTDTSSSAAEDGFAAGTPVTKGPLQKSMSSDSSEGGSTSGIPALMPPPPPNQPQLNDTAKPIEPKDELIDVIRGLRTEKIKKREGTAESELASLKPNWQPKADIPSSVPKLPTEYIHRHRLMKQAVNCLLDQNGAGPRDTDDEVTNNTIITAITSRHADKPGNGKTTLAVAAIQTVEVRERFCDGIAWIQLGRNPLTEKEVRRLYEELFRQLVTKDADGPNDDNGTDDGSRDGSQDGISTESVSVSDIEGCLEDQNAIRLAESRQRFQGGELDAIKEDLANIITKRKILICLDDVWRVDDAKWFIFDTRTGRPPPSRSGYADDPYPYRILMTSRTPSLLGPGVVQEVFVRIFSEHEAVKLLLSSAGRRPYGGKQSAVFNQARAIVKGCGNSPMAVRLAGGMLRRSNKNWNLSSPTWTSLIEQSKLNLEEASRLRSFVNSVTRVVDLGFANVDAMELRVILRRCFITFAVAFRDNDWVHIGKGIPQPVLLKVFSAVIDCERYSAEEVLACLETMNLLERARHGTTSPAVTYKKHASTQDNDDDTFDDEEEASPLKSTYFENPSFVMQDSLRAIGEEFAQRQEPSFLPEVDEFTSFEAEIKDERKYHDTPRGIIGGALHIISKSISGEISDEGIPEVKVHRLVSSCLVDTDQVTSAAIADAFCKTGDQNQFAKGGDKLEEYMTFFLPSHLIRSRCFAAAGELLINAEFITRRVKCFGAAEGSRKHVADLLELRREAAKESTTSSKPKSPQSRKDKNPQNGNSATSNSRSTPIDDSHEPFDEMESVDSNAVLRDACRTLVEEVHRVVSNARGSADSLSMAICLSTVGEALMKGKQLRDAMLRLEEAVIIYRTLLGEFHVDVARSLHSVARALVKLGENRVALHKFTEAADIYERCNATMHYDSIANSQNLATLLVDLGEWDKAAKFFNDVISKKKTIYGEGSVSVAKTINSYAILLAKHGRMNEALANYEAAKETYEAVPPSLLQDVEFDIKCKYDITLINLNIASIRSKKGDMQGAIKSYAEGVRGLREYETSQEKLMVTTGTGETGKNTSHVKHLVAALGRIGSLKLKIGDNMGALEAYAALLEEVTEDSPQASRIEAAKAHIKCATIYRQEEGNKAHSKSIGHLREALGMYSVLFGPDHKDTLAIASSLRQWLAEEPGKSN